MMHMQIDSNTKYVYRNGEKARIICVDRNTPVATVVSLSPDGAIREHNKHGISILRSDFDLVELPPYADFMIDDPVMVRDAEGDNWVHAYFAGVDYNGYALTFRCGRTSWTNADAGSPAHVPWAFCRYPTLEERNQ